MTMALKKQVTFWSSFALFITSVVLITLYFSCVNICLEPVTAFAAPIWTAGLCMILAIYGFAISSDKLKKGIWDAIYSTVCVISVICTLVCIYLIIGALIKEAKNKESSGTNYMAAMVLLIAMCATAGTMCIFTILSTSVLKCCPYCNSNEDADATEMAMASWAKTTTDYVRNPPYAPSAADAPASKDTPSNGVLSPTAPPLFLSGTIQREQGMDLTPSADQRSFSSNLVMADLIRETMSSEDEGAGMPTFASRSLDGGRSLDGDRSLDGGRSLDRLNVDGTAENSENNSNSSKPIIFVTPEDADESDDEAVDDYTEIEPEPRESFLNNRAPEAEPEAVENDYDYAQLRKLKLSNVETNTLYVNSTVRSQTLPQ